MQNNNSGRRGLSFLMVGMLIFMIFMMFNNSARADKENYSLLIEKFLTDEVSEFTLDLSNGKLVYKLWTDDEDDPYREYTVPNVDIFIADVREHVLEYNREHPYKQIEYNYIESTSWLAVILSFLPYALIIIMVIVFYNMMSQQGGKIGSVGKAKTKQGIESERTATFADVAGADEEKEELQEIVEYLKNPQKFNSLGAKIPKGVLLVGPPGTGKTLLARAVAGEAGVPFYSISGSDFVELYVGVGASRVRDLFEKAKKTRPSIIFIDEIDAVGRQRGAGLGGGHDEREQTLNQLLVELDGFSGNEGVIVMAATNRDDILDHALLRPGRFDRKIYVGYPDVKGREEILKVHSRGKPMGPDINLNTIAKSTPGFTGADLENLLNEAALLAARNGKKAITQAEIEEASIKVMAGPEKRSRVVSDKQRRLVAYHEAGHAIAHYYATPDKPVHMVSIIPRGQMGGFTMSLPDDDDSMLMSKSSMMNDIITLMGGRVAEQLILHDISNGASSDLDRATKMARAMVTRYGFSDSLGPVVYDSHDEVFLGRDFSQSRNYSEQVANEIDKEVRNIIDQAYGKCEKILTDHMDQLHQLAEVLLEMDKVDGSEFDEIMKGTFKLPENSSANDETSTPEKKESKPKVTRKKKIADDEILGVIEVESIDVTEGESPKEEKPKTAKTKKPVEEKESPKTDD